ncbi:MAG: hypothetical protein ACM3JG_07625 [Thiohalocapsa sp.]
MLTREFMFGMNIISLAGFAVMAVALALSRQQPVRIPLAVGLMGAGTALLLLGLYLMPAAAR